MPPSRRRRRRGPTLHELFAEHHTYRSRGGCTGIRRTASSQASCCSSTTLTHRLDERAGANLSHPCRSLLARRRCIGVRWPSRAPSHSPRRRASAAFAPGDARVANPPVTRRNGKIAIRNLGPGVSASERACSVHLRTPALQTSDLATSVPSNTIFATSPTVARRTIPAAPLARFGDSVMRPRGEKWVSARASRCSATCS